MDSDISNLFAWAISFGASRDFARSSSFAGAIKKYPTLGADNALALDKSKWLNIADVHCPSCKANNLVTYQCQRTEYFCSSCGVEPQLSQEEANLMRAY